MIRRILLIVVLISPIIFGLDKLEYENLINSSNNLALNFQFDSSFAIIEKAIELDPDKPEAFQILSKIHLWYFLGSNNEIDYKRFFDYSDSTITKIDIQLEENENDQYLIYLLGNIYKYRAMAYGANGNSLDAFWATKKAVSFYEDVIDLDPNFYAAYGGIGIFEYALSYVPAFFNWALTISGLSADKDNGFTFIKKAAEMGNFDKWEFQFHLSKLYDEHMAEYEKSIDILNIMIDRFPDNLLFRYQRAIEFIKNKNLDYAINELEFVLLSDNKKFAQTNSFSKFLLGDINFRKQNYKLALEYYLNFLTTTNTIDYAGIASIRVAYCYYFLGNENEYRKYTLLAANGNLDLEDDRLAYDLSMNLIDEGMTKDRQILIFVENNFLAGDDSTSLEIINNYADSIKSNRIKSEILTYKSFILIKLNMLEEAKKTSNDVIELNNEFPNWVKPMSLFNLAKISYNNNDLKTAEELLIDVEENNEYEKQNLIQSYITGLRKKIKSKQ